MKSPSIKQRRILARGCAQLFAARAFGHDNTSDGTYFARALNLSDHRVILLSDRGLDQLRTIAVTLAEADLFGGDADYGDYWAATKTIVQDCMSDNVQPENEDELIEMVVNDLRPRIATHTFIVSLQGVKIADGDVRIGAVRLARPGAAILDAAGVKYDKLLPKVMEIMGPSAWLIAEARGTERVATRRFTALASLFAGLLAIYAACRYERGATGFRIAPVIGAVQGTGRTAWLSWSHDTQELTMSLDDGAGKQRLEIDATVTKDFAEWPVLQGALDLVRRMPRTPLEDAIVRAIYWFGDAHRDVIEVMQLVKYWSCVECFFSAENKKIANAVSSGLAAMLLYGDYQFGTDLDYRDLKARINRLYDLRSRALHGASHHHVTAEEVAQLSQWVAWMLFNMISLCTRGFTAPSEVRKIARRLDEALSGTDPKAGTT